MIESCLKRVKQKKEPSIDEFENSVLQVSKYSRVIVLFVITGGCAVVLTAWFRPGAESALAAARAAARNGDATLALSRLDPASADPRTRDDAELLRAELLLERGETKAAAAALDRVKPDGPREAEFTYWKGRVLFQAGQPFLAESYFKAARRLKPNDADIARWLAAAAYEIGDRGEAVAALDAVTKLDPKDPRARRTLGLILQENEEYEDAAKFLGESLRLDRAQPLVRLDLAECLLKLGRLDESAKQLDECEGNVPEGRRLELAASVAHRRGDPEAAGRATDAGLKVEPDRPGLLLLRARLRLANGEREPALDDANRAIAAEPYRSESFYLRAQILKVLGREEDARKDFAAAAELSASLQELSRLDEQAARNPTDPEIRTRLGTLCERLGKPELAESWYKAALACDPKHEPASTALQALRGRRGVSNRGRIGSISPSTRSRTPGFPPSP